MKVYISSTMNDLREHRAAVANVLEKLNHDILGMETYPAEGVRPAEVCKRDATEADVVVLILAWRYGFVPQDDNPAGLSITEMEYRAALAANPKKVVPLVAEPESPWAPNLIDALSKGDDGARIERFRNEVLNNHVTAMFGSPDECASEAAAGVSRAELRDQMVGLALRSADRASFEQFRSQERALDDSVGGEIVGFIARAANRETVAVALGAGEHWWSTRLYLLASLARDLTTIRAFAFTGAGDELVGLSTPRWVSDVLSERFPELAHYETRQRKRRAVHDPGDEARRRLQVWIEYFDGLTGGEPAKRAWVGQGQLEEWLGDYLIRGSVEVDVEAGITTAQAQQIIGWAWPYVPIIDRRPGSTDDPEAGDDEDGPATAAVPLGGAGGARLMVVNRDDFAIDLARGWVAREMPRNRAR
jgi:hypothetical protein